MNLKRKVIFLISLFILLPGNIYAEGKEADVEKKGSPGTDIIAEKNKYAYSKELILCSYGCTGENIGNKGAQCGTENESFSAILYNTDSEGWSIETNLYLQPIKMAGYEGNYVIDDNSPAEVYNYKWTGIGTAMPLNGIYYESPLKSGNVNESWEKTQAYNDLKNNFACPQKMFYDHTIDSGTETVHYETWTGKEKVKRINLHENNNMELCYEDNGGSCQSRYEKDKTVFGKSNNLNYSFVTELNKVLANINNEIISSDKVNFLLNYYATEEDVCTAIKAYNGTQFGSDLESKNYINYVNEALKKHAENSPNKKFYNYEDVSRFNIILGETINKEYNNLEINYENKLGESVEYYVNKCTPELSQEEKSRYVEESVQQITNKIQKDVAELKEELDFGTLTCDELLGDIAEIIGTAYFILEIVAIVIAVALTVLDYAKVILSDDKDSMKKTNQKLLKRLIIVVIILLLPALVNLILTAFNIQNFNSENPLCKINK